MFTNKKGESIKNIDTALRGALRRSCLDKFTFHDLRHTFATNLVMKRVDLTTVKELLGHKSIMMTMRYSHPTPEHKKQAVESLDVIMTGQEMVKKEVVHNTEGNASTRKY